MENSMKIKKNLRKIKKNSEEFPTEIGEFKSKRAAEAQWAKRAAEA